MVQVREKTLEEVQAKLAEMRTAFNKIVYLEDALKCGFTYEVKRVLYLVLIELYEEKKMYEKAARVAFAKAGIDFSYREKVESYLKAAELYAKVGKVDDSEDMFVRAMRDANFEQKQGIKLARKNIYLVSVKELEAKGKKGSALKFYERLIQMGLEDVEKNEIKKKLIETYKALGKFKDAEFLEGM